MNVILCASLVDLFLSSGILRCFWHRFKFWCGITPSCQYCGLVMTMHNVHSPWFLLVTYQLSKNKRENVEPFSLEIGCNKEEENKSWKYLLLSFFLLLFAWFASLQTKGFPAFKVSSREPLLEASIFFMIELHCLSPNNMKFQIL